MLIVIGPALFAVKAPFKFKFRAVPVTVIPSNPLVVKLDKFVAPLILMLAPEIVPVALAVPPPVLFITIAPGAEILLPLLINEVVELMLIGLAIPLGEVPEVVIVLLDVIVFPCRLIPDPEIEALTVEDNTPLIVKLFVVPPLIEIEGE